MVRYERTRRSIDRRLFGIVLSKNSGEEMLYLAAYFAVLAIAAVCFYKKCWYRMDHRTLSAQPLFWASIAAPVLSFIFFGYFAWHGRSIDMSSDGFKEFVAISKLPLALLSLSIPLSAIIASAHRATQTASQIEVVLKKNALDSFYAHEKSFIEKIRSLDFGETDIFSRGKQAEKIAITTPYSLYRRIYAGASARQDSDYFPDSSFEFVIRAKLKGISDALWKHVDRMEKTGQGPVIGDDLEQVYAILLMTYEIFDHVGIGNISSNYYYAKSATKGIQVNLDSEIAFKQALRILLDIATSVIDIVSLKPLVDVDGIRRYAFSPHPYFLAFNDVADIQDFRAPSWRKTLNLFRIPNHDTVSKEALRAESGDST